MELLVEVPKNSKEDWSDHELSVVSNLGVFGCLVAMRQCHSSTINIFEPMESGTSLKESFEHMEEISRQQQNPRD